MITAFNSEPIYMGTDVTEYNRICDILEKNKIPYKTQTLSADERVGIRNFRGHGVTVGADIRELYEYSIRVRKADLENVQWLVAGKK